MVGLWLLGPLLTFLAKFAPSLAGPAKAVNATMSYVLHKQTADNQKTIEEYQSAVGQALGQIRAEMPEVAARITPIIDAYTTPKQQVAIKEIADATHGATLAAIQPPTTNQP